MDEAKNLYQVCMGVGEPQKTASNCEKNLEAMPFFLVGIDDPAANICGDYGNHFFAKDAYEVSQCDLSRVPCVIL